MKKTNGSTIRTRPIRRMTQAELDGFLEKAADILRGNVDHSEFRGYVFALLFFRRISDVFQEEVAGLTKKLGDAELARDPKMHNFVVPDGCLWEEVARKNANQLGTALNEAMLAIERANESKFDGILTNKIDFNKQDELPRSKLVDLINHFSSQCFDRAHVPDDLFGNAYEYLIRAFASKAGKSSGEFYTPKEVAYLMAQIVEPRPGHHVCDWASGSAGLLLQCRRYVNKHHKGRANELFLYAQESNVATYNISRINMILHGVSPSGWFPKREDSLRQPLHLDARQRLMRILVPWRAFGQLEQCRKLIPKEEAELLGDIDIERQATLKDIHDAYDSVLAPLVEYKKEFANLEASKAEKKKLPKEERARQKERFAELKRAIKELAKLDDERTEKLADANAHADRQTAQVKEAAADLMRICSDAEEARRYFAVADRTEIEENEFNLNLPRYVDTFEPEKKISIETAIGEFQSALSNCKTVLNKLQTSLSDAGIRFDL